MTIDEAAMLLIDGARKTLRELATLADQMGRREDFVRVVGGELLAIAREGLGDEAVEELLYAALHFTPADTRPKQ